MALCYILYSSVLNRYYIGATQDTIANRLWKHNNSVYGNKKFTSKANDWELYLWLECANFGHALRVERFIKRMKSRKFIASLKQDPELAQGIINKCL